MEHEDITIATPVQGSSDRAFGFVFTALFTVIALLPLRSQQPVRVWALIAAAGLLIVSLAIPILLGPLNRLWTQLAVLLHKIMSPVALGAIFFLVATPTAMLMRWFGKDPLRLQWDPQAASYWIKRAPPVPETMKNQF